MFVLTYSRNMGSITMLALDGPLFPNNSGYNFMSLTAFTLLFAFSVNMEGTY